MVCDGQEQVGFRRFLKVREMGLETKQSLMLSSET